MATIYNGYRFRSRLEARWAVFFDAIGMKYEYEPEGYDLGDGVRYLPDFYLPEERCFAEVKANQPNDAELDKMCRLVLLAADYYELPYKAGVFLTGSPDYNSTKQIIEIRKSLAIHHHRHGYWEEYIEMAIEKHDMEKLLFFLKQIQDDVDVSLYIDAFRRKIPEFADSGYEDVLLQRFEDRMKEMKIHSTPLRFKVFGFYSGNRSFFGLYPTTRGCEQARQARFEHGETPRPGS